MIGWHPDYSKGDWRVRGRVLGHTQTMSTAGSKTYSNSPRVRLSAVQGLEPPGLVAT